MDRSRGKKQGAPRKIDRTQGAPVPRAASWKMNQGEVTCGNGVAIARGNRHATVIKIDRMGKKKQQSSVDVAQGTTTITTKTATTTTTTTCLSTTKRQKEAVGETTGSAFSSLFLRPEVRSTVKPTLKIHTSVVRLDKSDQNQTAAEHTALMLPKTCISAL